MQAIHGPPAQLMSEEDVARMTGLKVGTLRVWRSRRKRPAYRKLGTRVLYELADVTAWIEAQPRTTHCS